MKNSRLIGVAFVTALIFGGLNFVPQTLSASDTQSTQKSWWQRQKEKRAASKNQMNISNPQNVSTNESQQQKNYNANVCGRCLNPIEAKKFTQTEISYCKKSCPNDPDIQDEIYPANLFAENISRKRDVTYNKKVNLVELLRKLENRMGLEAYRQCDGMLQQLYANKNVQQNPTAKNNLELQLRQSRKMFHDNKAMNLNKINTLHDADITEEVFIETFFDMYGAYDLSRKNCTRDFGLISEQLNKSMTSTTTIPQKKGWGRSK